MKKVMMILAILFSLVMQANAQWVKSSIKGDELLGTEEHVTYMYTCGETTVIFNIDNNENSSLVISGNCVFDSYKGSTAGKIGIYDKDENIVKKYTNRSFLVSNHFRNAVPWGLSDKIIDYLMNKEGHVRFLIRKYGGDYLDIDVPCITEDNIEDVTNLVYNE